MARFEKVLISKGFFWNLEIINLHINYMNIY
jgi:hypothetical protein